jgi:hypothetical protein
MTQPRFSCEEPESLVASREPANLADHLGDFVNPWVASLALGVPARARNLSSRGLQFVADARSTMIL